MDENPTEEPTPKVKAEEAVDLPTPKTQEVTEPEIITTPVLEETPIPKSEEIIKTEPITPPASDLPTISSPEPNTEEQLPTRAVQPEINPTETKPPETKPEPITEPVIITPIPTITPLPESAKQPTPVVEAESIPESKPQVFDINNLTNDQLKAAASLYTKRNQAEISRKGVAKRKETMELNLREIVDFLSLNNGSPLPRIAKHTNITPGTTSKYLRQLIKSGKVHAEGWGKTRRYFLK